MIPEPESPDIEAMAVGRVDIYPCDKLSVTVSLHGVTAEDFVTCCDEELLRAIDPASYRDVSPDPGSSFPARQ